LGERKKGAGNIPTEGSKIIQPKKHKKKKKKLKKKKSCLGGEIILKKGKNTVE